MDPLVPLFAFMVTMVIYFSVEANKQSMMNDDNDKTEEEKDDEWLDNQL